MKKVILFFLVFSFLACTNKRLLDPVHLKSKGIEIYQPAKFQKGLNLYNFRYDLNVKLIDMEGEEHHSWHIQEADKYKGGSDGLHYVSLDTDNNLFALVQVRSIIKKDWNNKLLWEKKIGAHHDLEILPDKSIYTYDLQMKSLKFMGKTYRAYLDDLVQLDENGDEIKRIEIYRFLKKFLTKEMLAEVLAKEKKGLFLSDIFHMNSIELIKKDIPGIANKGNLLLSSRDLRLIFIFDTEAEKIKWYWQSDEIYNQHSPTITKNNTILLLDNGSKDRGFSRVLELDPHTKKIIREITKTPAKSFFTETIGGVQELRNGNILVCTGRQGGAFEVTKNDEIVWEFDSSSLKDGNSYIYRFERY